jgi:excinuclease ABC subunit C
MIIASKLIESELALVPNAPGIYRMLNQFKQIIYIGKAKNLKKRLSSYTKPDLIGKTANIVAQTYHLEYVTTNSEVEALLMEAQLIKKFQPKFNILLKDDKSFPYIQLRTNHDFPQLVKYRGKDLSSGKFFGPFASALSVNMALNELQKIFKLRNCTDTDFANRTRPCIQYEIGRCYAPCVKKISKEDYSDLVWQVQNFLTGKGAELQKILSQKMEDLSSSMRFEEAAEIRDRIKALSYIQLKSGLQNSNIIDADIVAIAEENNNYCIQVFFYRARYACGNMAFFPTHTNDSTKSEVLETFISQFYQNRPPPKEILLNHNITNHDVFIEAIQTLHNTKTKLSTPNHTHKIQLLENAYSNAVLALRNHLKKAAKNQAMFEEIRNLLKINDKLQRIEIYDNSHISGTHAIGAMVVATPEGLDKKEYRAINIKDHNTGDDYAMLQEVLTRRFTRLQTEPDKKPNLMIIDGGKGHMSVVQKVLMEFNLTIPFLCMSKGADRNAGREQFHAPNHATFTLDKNSNLMKYLQILRDEAHNFAIKKHRLKRSRGIKTSSLDNIPNIGEARKKALLNYFGDFKTIQDASIAELTKAPGISKVIAKTIFDALHH